MPSVRAGAQSYPPAWNSAAHYAVGDQVQLGGNVYRAIKAITSGGLNPSTSYPNWELNYVRSNTTLMIGTGQVFPTLVSAWSYLQNAKIADGAYAHLYFSSAHGNFNESFTSPFLLDHASGARIAILGDSNSNDTLTFASNGFVLDTDHTINTIAGLTIQATTTSGTGIKADTGAVVLLSGVLISQFSTSVQSSNGAYVTVDPSSEMSNFSGAAFLALDSGVIVCNDRGNGSAPDVDIGPGNELQAEWNGVIISEGSFITNVDVGALAEYGGVIDLTGANLENDDVAVLATSRGFVRCQGATLTPDGGGLQATLGGYIDATNSMYSGAETDSNGSYIVLTGATQM
jgi:hypothetical protein